MRTNGPFPLVLTYGSDPSLSDALRTPTVTTAKEGDSAAVIRIDGLGPDEALYYRVEVAGEPDP